MFSISFAEQQHSLCDRRSSVDIQTPAPSSSGFNPMLRGLRKMEISDQEDSIGKENIDQRLTLAAAHKDERKSAVKAARVTSKRKNEPTVAPTATGHQRKRAALKDTVSVLKPLRIADNDNKPESRIKSAPKRKQPSEPKQPTSKHRTYASKSEKSNSQPCVPTKPATLPEYDENILLANCSGLLLEDCLKTTNNRAVFVGSLSTDKSSEQNSWVRLNNELGALNKKLHKYGENDGSIAKQWTQIRNEIAQLAVDLGWIANLSTMPSLETLCFNMLNYAKSKERFRASDEDREIHNYCHNLSECPRHLSDVCHSYAKHSGNELSKDEIQSRIANGDLHPFLFDVDEDKKMASLGKKKPGKSSMEIIYEQSCRDNIVEMQAKKRIFLDQRAAIKRFCLEMGITESQMYEYPMHLLNTGAHCQL
jgi:hypothetical protein